MLKSLSKLDWDKLLDHLETFLNSDFSKRFCKELVPNFSFEEAQLLQDKTHFIWNLFEKGINIEVPALKSLKEILNKASKRGLFLPLDLVEIKKWFEALKKITPFLQNSPFSILIEFYKELSDLEHYLDKILDYQRGDIKDRASYQLYVIRKKIKEAQELLFFKLEKIKDHFYKKGYLQDNLITQKEGRYVLPVKTEYKNKVKGILHEVSQSGATVFIEPIGIVSLSNEIEDLKSKEHREIIKILKNISEEIFQRGQFFSKLEEVYIDFEISLAKAKLGRSYRGIFPGLKKEGDLKIISGIHPLLILQKENVDKKPVYNDFIIEKGLLISGPNLGGKTVSLKTVGLLSLMAQTGFLIPAKSAEVPVFSQIFIDMGDDQDILQGESSFSSHIKNLKMILDKANKESIVLLDEPGKGTNPEEGMALISAILEELIDRGAKVILTTHSQFLKTVALKMGKLKIATMEYNFQNKEPTYRLVYGLWGESLAFDLAKKLGLPDKIISKATSYLKNKEYWQWHKILEEETQKIKELKEKLKIELEILQKEKQILEEEKRKIKEIYQKKLEEKLIYWDEQFKSFIQELKIKKTGSNKVLKKFDRFINKVLEETSVKENSDVKEGDIVKVLPFKKEAEVLKVKEKTLELRLGNLKMEIPKNNVIEIISKKKSQNFTKNILLDIHGFQKKSEDSPKEDTLKLLGFTVDEALFEVEKRLNKAFLEGIERIYLIHGHGSGKLREAIRKYLQKHPLVKSFNFAEPWKGGTGVTVVYLEEKK